MVRLKLLLLGPAVASLGEEQALAFPYTKVKALLIYLAVSAAEQPGVAHGRGQLMELLWPELSLKPAQDNLRQTLYQLRRLLTPATAHDGDRKPLRTTRSAIQLSPGYEVELDVAAFTRHLQQGRLADAVALYRGDFLADFYLPDSSEYEAWVAARRATYREWALTAFDTLTERCLAEGHLAAVRWEDKKQMAIEPALERASRQLMTALARSGERTAALTEYERCRRELEEALGVDPSWETELLYHQIRADDIRAELVRPAVAVVVPPLPEEEPEPSLFVGRRWELEQLGGALAAVQNGHGQLRFVTGEAGSGKTSLVNAFARHAQEADDRLLVCRAQGYVATGTGNPYLLFRDLLAQLTGDVTALSGGSTAEQRRRLWAAMPVTVPALLHHAPDLIDTLVAGKELRYRAATFADPTLDWFRQLSERLDSDRQEQLVSMRLTGQVVALLRAIAAERPLLLILEDLHWADAASVDLLAFLSGALQASHVLLLGTYRPEGLLPAGDGEPHPLAAVLGELRRFHGDIAISLDEMIREERHAFVDELLDSEPNHLDEHFRQALFAHTRGHALFTVELLRAMQERGELAQDESGRWVAGSPLDWTALPARVDGVIEQRLGRLDETLYSALATASVEGELFTAEVVARVEEQPPPQLVRRLSREIARQHRLIQVEAATWAGGQRLSHFRFRHQLFQQHLYQSLTEVERVYLHESVGRALETLYGEKTNEIASQLAWHFEQAGLVAPAVHYLVVAAHLALEIGAAADAEKHSRRGLALLEAALESHELKRQELLLSAMLGSALSALQGFSAPAVQEAFARAWQLRHEAVESVELLRILYGTWVFYLDQGDFEMARSLAADFLHQFLCLESWEEDAMLAMMAHKATGVTCFHTGELEPAARYLAEVVARYDPAMQPDLIAHFGYDVGLTTMIYYSATRWWQGYIQEANHYWDQALELAQRSSHPFTRAFVPALTILTSRSWGEPELVLAKLADQLAVARQYDFLLPLVLGGLEEAVARGALGSPEAAIDDFEKLMAAGAEAGAGIEVGGLGELAMLCFWAGRLEAGLVHVDNALRGVQRIGELYLEPELYRLRGELLWRQGAPAPAIAAVFEQAIQSAQRNGAGLAELRATASLCRLLQAQGQGGEARLRLAPLLERFAGEAGGSDFHQARALLRELNAA
jgi:DNA-binding SARP family transcriptional activator